MTFDYTDFDRTAKEVGCTVYINEPMAKHTTFRIGGAAERMVVVKDVDMLRSMISYIKKKEIPFFIMGNGSNLLVSDKGIKGVVMVLAGEFKKIHLVGDKIKCGAGVSLASLCTFARDNGLSGIEFAWGIPGTVGGAVCMNAGAYGGEMRDVVRCVRHLNATCEVEERVGGQLKFSYRTSAYTGESSIILGADFLLEKGSVLEICSVMDDLMKKRKDKQPYDMPSAGSIFKRPEGYYAAALIEECGLKGHSVGAAQVSTKHSGFIVNRGDACAKDVMELVDYIKETVYREKGIQLHCEIKMVGEF